VARPIWPPPLEWSSSAALSMRVCGIGPQGDWPPSHRDPIRDDRGRPAERNQTQLPVSFPFAAPFIHFSRCSQPTALTTRDRTSRCHSPRNQLLCSHTHARAHRDSAWRRLMHADRWRRGRCGGPHGGRRGTAVNTATVQLVTSDADSGAAVTVCALGAQRNRQIRLAHGARRRVEPPLCCSRRSLIAAGLRRSHACCHRQQL
jgi:hypothetical protein